MTVDKRISMLVYEDIAGAHDYRQRDGYREYSATDLEGHLWSFMKPVAP